MVHLLYQKEKGQPPLPQREKDGAPRKRGQPAVKQKTPFVLRPGEEKSQEKRPAMVKASIKTSILRRQQTATEERVLLRAWREESTSNGQRRPRRPASCLSGAHKRNAIPSAVSQEGWINTQKKRVLN